MEHLWAPWRMEFIRKEKTDGCFLCEAAAAEPEGDRGNLVLHRCKLAFVIMNKFPYNNGHLLVAPFRHEGSFEKLIPDELAEIMALAQRWGRIIEKEMHAQGFNMGFNMGRAAGAGLVDHLHFHIVPRWVGDTNFMPVLAGAHVIPQALDELYDRLRDRLRAELDAEAGAEAGAS